MRRLALAACVLAVVTGLLAADGAAPGLRIPQTRVGNLTALWTRPVELTPVTMDIGSSSILTQNLSGKADGLGVVDAATGITRWRSPQKGSWLVAGDAPVVAAPSLALVQAESTVLAVSLRDGSIRWHADLPVGTSFMTSGDLIVTFQPAVVTARHGSDGLPIWQWPVPDGCSHAPSPPAGTPIVIACPGRVIVLGRDGTVTREWQTGQSCAVVGVSSSESLVAVAQACDAKKPVVTAWAYADGVRLWQRRIPTVRDDPEPPQLQTAGDVVAIDGDVDLAFVRRDGSDLLAVENGWCDEICVSLRAGVAYLVYTDKTTTTLAALTVANGVRVWSDEFSATNEVEMAGNRAYVRGNFVDNFPSDFLSVVDMATGKQTAVATLTNTGDIVGAAHDFVFITYSTTRGEQWIDWLAAVREPDHVTGELGGAARWPDACDLVPAADLGTFAPPAMYTAIPGPQDTGLDPALPMFDCSLVPDVPTAPVIRIGVIWAGTSGSQSYRLDEPNALPVAGIGDWCVHISRSRPDGVDLTTFMVGVGDLVVGIDVVGDRSSAVAAVSAVVDHLRTRSEGEHA